MSALFRRAKTLWRLGIPNLVRVGAYRAAIRVGLHPVQRARGTVGQGPFFSATADRSDRLSPQRGWTSQAKLFGRHGVPIDETPPAWTRSPLAQADAAPPALDPWWTIPDFVGDDIKDVWEFSRFDWALAFAQQARCGNPQALQRLNSWLQDWVTANPPFLGPNWKCGQEASIRLMHLSLAASFLQQESRPSAAVSAFIASHLARIGPTLAYARAQDNNHATSEAAALFVAGCWLSLSNHPEASALEKRGRNLLEQTVARLILPDGTFSQYSTNYHRVVLDTLSIAEFWRRRSGAKAFSPLFRERAAAASEWLRTIVDATTGDAPNIGANDGANLLPLSDTDYRDFRVSAQLGCHYFQCANAYPPGPWDEAVRWLGVERAERDLPAAQSRAFDKGGFAVLRHGPAMAVLRYPRFAFRPSQADALHVDFWLSGTDVLRDGGSYRYNTDDALVEYFGGVASHNTIQFDSAPQMPRLGRFLLGDWLKTEAAAFAPQHAQASYRSKRERWRHDRDVQLGDALLVTDTVEGFAREAVLRWRLQPGDWTLSGGVARSGSLTLEISSDVPGMKVTLVEGFESRYYGEMTPLPVVEARIARPGKFFSKLSW